MTITAYPDVDALLGQLLDGIRNALGERLLGLYLYGSLVAGDFTPGTSDVDLLAATATIIDEREFALLDAMHQRVAAERPEWDGRIEIAYVSAEALQTFREKASPIGIMSPGEPFHIVEAGHDWLVNWWVVRENGITLYGPPPQQLISPITRREFLDVVRDHARRWPEWLQGRKRRKSQSYAILTMCRAWYAVTFGRQPSKQQAARWVQEQLPERSALIERALEWRVAPENDDDDQHYPETVQFVADMSARVLSSGS